MGRLLAIVVFSLVATAPAARSQDSAAETGAIQQAPVARRTAVLTGRCRTETFAHLAGVSIAGPGLEAGAASAVDGMFVYEVDLDGWSRQRWDYSFTSPGLGTVRLQADLVAGQMSDLGDIAFEAAAIVRGVVRSVEGEPLEGVTVRVSPAVLRGADSALDGPEHWFDETLTGAEGAFEFDDLESKHVTLWAGGGGLRWEQSALLQVEAGESCAVDLFVRKLTPRDTVELVVVDAEGAPVPRAVVRYTGRLERRVFGDIVHADALGHVRFDAQPGATYSLVVSDPAGILARGLRNRVVPGTDRLVIRLVPRREFVLHARGVSGEPVALFNAIIGSSSVRSHSEGELRFFPDQSPFSIEVTAKGYLRATRGPFSADQESREITVELHRIPSIHGTVRTAAGPLGEVRVSLHAAVSERDRYTVAGFPSSVVRWSEVDAVTDSAGRYELALGSKRLQESRSKQAWYLRAEAPGFPPTLVGPLTLDGRVGARGVDVQLGLGGVIEGQVLVGRGEDPAGTVVAFSRGDGFPFCLLADEAGRFRAPGLAAGPWQVRSRREAFGPWANSSFGSGGGCAGVPIAWTTEVVAGQVARVVVDVAAERLATVTGRVSLGGHPIADWGVWLSTPSGASLGAAGAVANEQGVFRLPPTGVGRGWVALEGPLGPGTAFGVLSRDLREGENPIEFDLLLGELSVAASRERFPHGVQLTLRSNTRSDLDFAVSLDVEEGEELVRLPFPVGPVFVEYSAREGPEGSVRAIVPPDSTAEVTLP